MKRIIKLTESDLTRIVRRVIMEQGSTDISKCFTDNGITQPTSCKSSPAQDKSLDLKKLMF